jgi:DUF4097 and DUF4098 domain-containing protein YvlB
MRKETFKTPGPLRLDLNNTSGAIEIETIDGTETTVELEALEGDAGAEAVAEARVELHERDGGQELVVDVPERRWLVFSRGADVLVRVRCPHGASGRVTGVAADIRSRGRFGDLQLKSVSGDVHVGEVDGELELKTVSGDASVRRVTRRAVIESISGDVVVDDARASLRTKTVSGDIQLKSVQEGEVAVQSVSGDVAIGVAQGSRVFVDAQSLSGDTTSELALDDAPGGEAPPNLEIRGKTLSGDLRITRATVRELSSS